MAYTTRQERCPLGSIETWIFDLDNTLYPASCRLFDQVQQKMNEFICERLSLSLEEAAELRRTYFRQYGTTLNGLMAVSRIDPHEFLDFVHEVDLACVPPDPALVAALGMTTAWVRNSVDWAAEAADGDYIHYVINDLAGFLAAAAALQEGERWA